jgi:hypothetical protein
MTADPRTYIKLHDGMPDHPKVVGLSDAAFRAYVELLCYCSRYLTDGDVPTQVVRKIAAAKIQSELVAAGLAEESPKGMAMHDYLEHQRSAEQAAEMRQKRQVAGKKGGEAKANALALAKQTPKQTASKNVAEGERSKTVAEVERELEELPKTLASTDGRTRKPDPIWDALLEVCKIKPAEITVSARGAINRAAADLRQVGASPEAIRVRAATYRRKWPNVSLTPTAIARRWSEVGDEPAGSQSYTAWR